MNTKTKTKTNPTPIIEVRLKELLEENTPINKIRAFLVIEDFKASDIESLLKREGLILARSSGFTYPDTLAFLGSEPRTEKELYTILLEEGSRNEARWILDRNKIRLTINTVFNNLGKPLVEEPANEALKKELKAKAKAS